MPSLQYLTLYQRLDIVQRNKACHWMLMCLGGIKRKGRLMIGHVCGELTGLLSMSQSRSYYYNHDLIRPFLHDLSGRT